MICVPQRRARAPCGIPTGRRRAGVRRPPISSGAGGALCTSSQSPSSARPRMNASVTATERLKLVSSPSSFAWMNALDVRMIAAQDAHLRAAPRARPTRPSRRLRSNTRMYDSGPLARLRALDARALRADRARSRSRRRRRGASSRRLVAARRRCPGRSRRREIAVADRLHEAIDERRLEIGAGGGIDASARDEAASCAAVECMLPRLPARRRLDLRPAHARRGSLTSRRCSRRPSHTSRAAHPRISPAAAMQLRDEG